MSAAGGPHKAIERAEALGLDTVQLFTASPQSWAVTRTNPKSQWAAEPIADDDVRAFRSALRKSKLKHPTAHDSYLINLAAPDEELWQKSVAAFVTELSRAEQLGLSYLVTHPGAHVGSGEAAGLKRVTDGLNEALRQTAGYKVKVLLENTAGMGSSLGHRFEHLAQLLDAATEPERVGVCFDTCHAFAAGYDISTEDGYAATFDEFRKVVGLRALKLFHVNDSVKKLGSRVDRHAGIGLGEIGDAAFRRLVTDARFRTRPMVLETPKDDDGTPMDEVNLKKLRGFSKGKPHDERGKGTIKTKE
jgi:deoxyribonuclease-4